MSPGIRDQKAGGKRGKRLPSGESGEAGSTQSLLARKRVQGPLQGLCTTIERTARSGIPPLRLPEALIFLRFRVFLFSLVFGFFPGGNSSGCSRAAMHCLAASKTRLPGISVYFRFFPWRKCLIYTSKATVPDNSDSRQSARYKFRCRSRTLGW